MAERRICPNRPAHGAKLVPRGESLRTGEPHHQLQRLHPVAEAENQPPPWAAIQVSAVALGVALRASSPKGPPGTLAYCGYDHLQAPGRQPPQVAVFPLPAGCGSRRSTSPVTPVPFQQLRSDLNQQ